MIKFVTILLLIIVVGAVAALVINQNEQNEATDVSAVAVSFVRGFPDNDR